jgi:hypothetical protein
MSEPETPGENFLRRWSLRKQASDSGAPANTEPPQSEHAESGGLPEVNPQADPPAFDPSSLPPIESISAASDIRAFLAPGVPEELSRAALRRAWVIDPTIRDFVGLAENQWDFTRPDEVPGFGSLEVTEELRRMITQLVGSAPAQAEAGAARTRQAADNPAKPPHQVSEQEDRSLEASVGSGAAHNAAKSPSDDLLAPRQTVVADNAAQKKSLDTTRTPGSARRRHGGALPR